MLNPKFFIFCLLSFLFLSASKEIKYSPFRVFIKGQVIDFATGKPVKKVKLYAENKRFDESHFYPDEWTDNDKLNGKGKFSFHTYLDLNKLELWLKSENYAQLHLINIQVDSTQWNDTIDLGKIYLVAYDNEMEIESYNMPKHDNVKRDDLLSIYEVDSLISLDTCLYNMQMSRIDTTRGFITRYNFGPDSLRGTTIQSFKTICFTRDLTKKTCANKNNTH